MWKDNRPEGWKTIPLWSRLCDGIPITSRHDAYEAGADAMYQPAYDKGKADLLEALIEKGTPHVNIPDNQVGVIVYIPIEGKKE